MIYAIGDIHGQKAMLDRALALITADGGDDVRIVFLGDYTDRGPDSRAVLETLIAGRDAGRNWHFIMGNHDRFFSRFLRSGAQHDPAVKSGISWLNPRLGGNTTLASYGVGVAATFDLVRPDGGLETARSLIGDDQMSDMESVRAQAFETVPAAHLDFLETLPLTHQTDDLLFVHAGLRPGIPLDKQDPEDLLWIRDGWLEDTRDHGRLVVHGHTALDAPQYYGNRVNLDGGAGYGRPLIPAVFEGRDCWLLTDTGRKKLHPQD